MNLFEWKDSLIMRQAVLRMTNLRIPLQRRGGENSERIFDGVGFKMLI